MPPPRELRRVVPLLAHEASYLAASARMASFATRFIPMFKRTVVQRLIARNSISSKPEFRFNPTVASRDCVRSESTKWQRTKKRNLGTKKRRAEADIQS